MQINSDCKLRCALFAVLLLKANMKLTILLGLIVISVNCFAKEMYAWQWIKDAKFSSAYHAVYGEFEVQPWVLELSGPSGKSSSVKVNGKYWYVIQSCEPHFCANNNVTIFYQSEEKVVVLLNSENTRFFGYHDEAIRGVMLAKHKSSYKYSDVYNRYAKSNKQ